MKLRIITLSILYFFISVCIYSQNVIKLGIIGLDTSHSPAFIKLLNDENAPEQYKGFKVVAAYPYGSKTIESSAKRIPGYMEEAKNNGVKITTSIAEMLKLVDCVLLETNDGNLHLEQALEVFKSGKPMFIDKPVAANLAETIAIFELSKKYNVQIFSSSVLRYSPINQEIRKGEHGKVLGADCYSPDAYEPSHADFTWYGIHGVETLYTVMGTGCVEVSRQSTKDFSVVTGVWADGRIGTFRAIRTGHNYFGGTVFCSGKMVQAGGYDGYKVLLDEILKFFRTKEIPVNPEETIEIFTFMEASNESKRQHGNTVSMESILEKGKLEARRILKSLDN
ncbi:Gfo/Idh/MocA family oxidoreductase [Dysgonomonas sp. Marseille-P4677]|uniref:Gfo/Idh/MocA family protein n=1 Tax=Dysgonomonas sp. Marseille-P4677 TaxID=2364790 RepID=UPI001912D911|nr:Gfo/Idh/MocA family oxidoreductase [Dysgonomonas sp. Marseille-P4677]MBK5720998.1 Gfo/Idh/MocA family oxidoreductase [Dysgonomonas sp. Marseille-P4677]